MIRGEEGYISIKDWSSGIDCWLVFRPIAKTGWSLGIMFPKGELLKDITRLNQMVAFIGVVGLFLLLGIVILIADSITKPLRALTCSVERIAQGDLDTPLPAVSSRDEIAILTATFAHMQSSLKHYMEELARTVAERERIESELTIAREIQMGILPKSFPPFPDRRDFDIYARLQPAREVGGDFYDFFFTDNYHFWVVIGDVSGKGVPASLFMAITRTLIKAKANGASSPGAVLEEVNRDLSADNPSVMFVTLFIGVLDTRTGMFTYANGGHNPPYLLRKDEKPQRLPTTKGMALGVYDTFRYRENSCALYPGDVLVLYTDGVTEALNRKEEFFSSERLEGVLETLKNLSPRELVEVIIEKVQDFSDGAPQADDITVLVMKFLGTID
jgi:sigma-B regulation protein RsbU (phosphoserine phosphatase)